MSEYAALIDLIKKSDSVAIFMHMNPDGDCVGSCLGMFNFLKKMGKRAYVIAPNFERECLSEKFSFLKGFDEISSVAPEEKVDLSLALDLGAPNRIGDRTYKLFLKGQKTAYVDHHIDCENFVDVAVSEPKAAATTQILYYIMHECAEQLFDRDIATCLYTGLVTDSGAFQFDSTTSRTHIAAAGLLEYGVDVDFVSRKVMKETKVETFNLKNRVLSKAAFYHDGQIGMIFFSKEDFAATGTTEKDTEGIINSVTDIVGVKLAISVSEITDKYYKVSFRSKDEIDSSACARCFGGGGHFHAAGCRISGYKEDVINKLLDVAREMMNYA